MAKHTLRMECNKIKYTKTGSRDVNSWWARSRNAITKQFRRDIRAKRASIYDTLFVNTTKKLGFFCWRGFDVKVVDGIVNGVARLVGALSSVLRYTQSGLFQNYALTMVLGTVVMLAIFILK